MLEGVMMKGVRSIATAVRTETGEITVESKRTKSVKEKSVLYRMPFVRGVMNLGSQLFAGTAILMRSAEVYGDFAEPSKAEKWMSDKLKINPMSLLMTVSVILGIVLAVGLFVFLPNFLTGLLFEIPALANSSLSALWYSLIEGVIMLSIFILYVLLVSLMKDIRRVFMYHGAEHKVISCYEHGLDLTVENARTMSTQHSRCGTTFMFFVIMVSILVFAFVNWGLDALGWLTDSSIINALIKLPCKLIFLPVVAGVSYELLKLLAKSDALPVRILRAPGMWLQKLTTKQPTDDMLEVSITAFKTVMAMDADPTIPETKFDIKMPYAIARKRLSEMAPEADESDIDWLLVEVTGKKRSELNDLFHLTADEYARAEKYAKELATGKPLQYVLGNTDFYGIRLSVNPSVLIPRPETELLAEKVIALLKDKDNAKMADVCTGSGAIAIAVAKNTNAEVYASDISAAAIEVAKANALNAGIKVSFFTGDLFAAFEGSDAASSFDVIAINPPYIPTADIEGLEKKVKDFEPKLALDGGTDGMKVYRLIAADFDKYLAADGTLVLEIGINQAEDITALFADFRTEFIKDYAGIDRIAVITRK